MNRRSNIRKKLKRIGAIACLFFVFLSLAACRKADSAVPKIGGLKTYDGGDFTMSLVPTWKVITPAEFYAEIPRETVVAFTSPEAYDGFFINVNILKEDLKQPVDPIDYARANINLSAQNLTSYTKIQEVNTALGDQKSLLHIFQARLNPAEKLIKFIQVYATKGNYGYVVTGGMLPDTPQDIRDQVGSMVTSFRIKKL